MVSFSEVYSFLASPISVESSFIRLQFPAQSIGDVSDLELNKITVLIKKISSSRICLHRKIILFARNRTFSYSYDFCSQLDY